MASGGDGSRAHQPGSLKAACLPLDIIADIAVLSDPATLVRCAATCKDARRRIAQDPSLLGRHRLHNSDRFVLPLVRGHMTAIIPTFTFPEKMNVYMVGTTGARLVEADKTLSNVVPMDSRGGLVLVRATTTTTAQNNAHQCQKLVCNLATRRCLALPPEPAFPYAGWSTDYSRCGVQYVLLVGGRDDEGADASVGRPFQVLMAKLVLSRHHLSYRRLLVHTFSSEHGAWSPLTEIPTPDLHGCGDQSWHQRPLVIGDVVHWLCLTDRGSYMLMVHVGAARVNLTSLPSGFSRDKKSKKYNKRRHYLLARATAGGNPVVLVADTEKVTAWEQSKHTKTWELRVVIENETILGFKDDGLRELVEKDRKLWKRKHVPELLWFGERSGVVLLRSHGYCLLWLDLHSKKIVRCFSLNRRLSYAPVYRLYDEVDLTSWVPTFSSEGIL